MKKLIQICFFWCFVDLSVADSFDLIVVAIEDYHYPPRYFFDERNQHIGIDVDLIKRVAQNMGVTPVFKKCPWKRCLALLRAGHVDVMPYLLKREDRSNFIEFLDPAYEHHASKCFFVNDKSLSVFSYDDLYNLQSIGIVDNAKYFPVFDLDEGLQKVVAPEEENLLDMLIHKRIDSFIAACTPMNYKIVSLGLKHKVFSSPYKYKKQNPVHIGISKKSSYMNKLELLSESLQQVLNAGGFEQIKADYFQ